MRSIKKRKRMQNERGFGSCAGDGRAGEWDSNRLATKSRPLTHVTGFLIILDILEITNLF